MWQSHLVNTVWFGWHEFQARCTCEKASQKNALQWRFLNNLPRNQTLFTFNLSLLEMFFPLFGQRWVMEQRQCGNLRSAVKVHVMTTTKKKIIHTTQSQCKSHPASKKYEFKPVLFGWLTLLAAASCFLCMSHVAFSLCKIWNLSPGSCGWTQMLVREGWGASLYSDPLMEKFSNPSRWVCSIPKCLMAVHGEWLPALGFSCPESPPPGWALSILSSSAGLALSF